MGCFGGVCLLIFLTEKYNENKNMFSLKPRNVCTPQCCSRLDDVNGLIYPILRDKKFTSHIRNIISVTP